MLDAFFLCLIVGVSSFTITYLIRYTDGPGNVFLKFRVLVKIVEPVHMEDTDEIVDYIEPLDVPDLFFSKLVYCFWCLTTWICLIMTVLAFVLLGITQYGLFPFVWFFAIGVSGILNQLTE